ncbi:MAG TPA: hypothetical protein VGX45_09435 [Solirubrobacteraceae bacterium]|jgi:hypothetical protein|nr:hypothetical protein [Solirubrobacteraceae bacterium]
MSDELVVLRALRLKGRAGPDGLSAATGVDEAGVRSILDPLVAGGAAREVNGFYMLLPAGRERQNELLHAERADVDGAAMSDVYEQFTAVNGDFKQLANDWQMRGDQPNDHSDASYDGEVLSRLPGIHQRVSPVLDAAAGLAPRLAVYGTRLTAALRRVDEGEHEWLLKPLIDSYHTVWFELHEELISLAGLSREAEALSGRAE